MSADLSPVIKNVFIQPRASAVNAVDFYTRAIVDGFLLDKSDVGHGHTAGEVSGLAVVATSGSYNDLADQPFIPTDFYSQGAVDGFLLDKSDVGHGHTAGEVAGLAAVATSGSYNDLADQPFIPSQLTDLDTTVTGAELNADHAQIPNLALKHSYRLIDTSGAITGSDSTIELSAGGSTLTVSLPTAGELLVGGEALQVRVYRGFADTGDVVITGTGSVELGGTLLPGESIIIESNGAELLFNG